MKIRLDEIPESGFEVKQTESASIIDFRDQNFIFTNPIEVKFFVLKSGKTLIITGTIATKVEMKCSRCLKFINEQLENKKVELTYEIGGEKELDITEDIREEVLLMLPIKPLCSENCIGVNMKIGKKQTGIRNKIVTEKIDDRWTELDKFKTE